MSPNNNEPPQPEQPADTPGWIEKMGNTWSASTRWLGRQKQQIGINDLILYNKPIALKNNYDTPISGLGHFDTASERLNLPAAAAQCEAALDYHLQQGNLTGERGSYTTYLQVFDFPTIQASVVPGDDGESTLRIDMKQKPTPQSICAVQLLPQQDR